MKEKRTNWSLLIAIKTKNKKKKETTKRMNEELPLPPSSDPYRPALWLWHLVTFVSPEGTSCPVSSGTASPAPSSHQFPGHSASNSPGTQGTQGATRRSVRAAGRLDNQSSQLTKQDASEELNWTELRRKKKKKKNPAWVRTDDVPVSSLLHGSGNRAHKITQSSTSNSQSWHLSTHPSVFLLSPLMLSLVT